MRADKVQGVSEGGRRDPPEPDSPEDPGDYDQGPQTDQAQAELSHSFQADQKIEDYRHKDQIVNGPVIIKIVLPDHKKPPGPQIQQQHGKNDETRNTVQNFQLPEPVLAPVDTEIQIEEIKIGKQLKCSVKNDISNHDQDPDGRVGTALPEIGQGVRDCQHHIDQHQGKKQPIVQSAPLPIQRGIDQKTSHEEQRGHIHYDTSGCSSRHSFYLLLPEYRYRDCRYRVPCTVIYARIHYLVCGGMCQGNTASVMIGLDLLTKIW